MPSTNLQQPTSANRTPQPSALFPLVRPSLPADLLVHIESKHQSALGNLPPVLTPELLPIVSACQSDLRFRLSLYRELYTRLPQVRESLPSADAVLQEIQNNETACLTLLLLLECCCDSWKEAACTVRTLFESPGFDRLGFKAVTHVLVQVQCIAVSLDLANGRALLDFVCSRSELPIGTSLPQLNLLLAVIALLERGETAEGLKKIAASRPSRASGVASEVAAAFEYLEAHCYRQIGNAREELSALKRWRELSGDLGRASADARDRRNIQRESTLLDGALRLIEYFDGAGEPDKVQTLREDLKAAGYAVPPPPDRTPRPPYEWTQIKPSSEQSTEKTLKEQLSRSRASVVLFHVEIPFGAEPQRYRASAPGETLMQQMTSGLCRLFEQQGAAITVTPVLQEDSIGRRWVLCHYQKAFPSVGVFFEFHGSTFLVGYAPILQAPARTSDPLWFREALRFVSSLSENPKIHWQTQVEAAVHEVAQSLYELPPPEVSSAVQEF